ncbi:hypothetical protein SAY86_006846 [Trapa natans]|uniref:Sec1 family domain-containing protein MIP3 n=1 Tax=Trapa natans TaxID=22666 RepID=A0AAN7LAJ3_TRANT|nr:hypothetical protein SAY86_006846 [Trapa natans]
MAVADVAISCLDSISQLSDHIKDSVLYLDGGCAESFQYLGAFPVLLGLGARAVCSLEKMSPLDLVIDWNSKLGPRGNIVIMTSHLLSDAHRYILRCLSSHQDVHHCTIFTCISEIAHSAYPDSPLGPDAFHEYETLLVQDFEELVKKRWAKATKSIDENYPETKTAKDEGWLQFTSNDEDIPDLGGRNLVEDKFTSHTGYVGKNLIVSVHHFPLIMCPLSPRAFVLPSEGSVAEAYLSLQHEDSLSQGLPPLNSGVPSDGDDASAGVILTAHFLYHLASKMDLKMEIFSLGNSSKMVGKILTDMSSLYDVGRRKRSAGLLLVDRTLDLLTPCCHGDSLVDRIVSCLPRRERTTASTPKKGSQIQLKPGMVNLQRTSLDFQIPLNEVLMGEDDKVNNNRLFNGIGSFLLGWNSDGSGTKTADSVEMSSNIQKQGHISPRMEELKGSIVATDSLRRTPYLEALLDRKTKDGVILVKKWLQEALRRENISINVNIRAGVASRSELLPMIEALAKSQSSLIRNKALIQLATATVLALDESQCARWDAFISAEKMLYASAGDTSQSLAAQIGDLINKSAFFHSHGQKNENKKKPQSLLSLQDALLLTAVGYILAGENFPTSGPSGPFSWQEERLLKETLVDAVIENPDVAELKFLHSLKEELEANRKRISAEENRDTPAKEPDIDDFDDDQWDTWGDEDTNQNKDHSYGDMQLKLELRDRVDTLFKFLHKLSSLKSRNKSFGEGVFLPESGFSIDSSTRKGFLYKLVTRVLSKSDVPGLEHHSSAVGRLFKSGFGRFGLGQAKPSLSDQDVILVFVVGGINGLEAREVQEAVSESGRPDLELLLGGTTLLTPNDMLDLLLGQYGYI